MIREFRAYRSGEADDSVIPVYDAVPVGNRIPVFRGNVMTSFSNRGAGNEVHLIYRIELKKSIKTKLNFVQFLRF